ncbi:phosphodiester glycosidase family protein [Acinetobacter ursingii]|nr:phosphodiester glycosidase family protein [Acinetobacter ursingii]MCH2005084.1 phosphodiester glycosidase family protein [Acinetobacter ursingii]MCU4304543.1 phosphodiester glycosidase family protein [Acinetobacter ursingii]MCU4370548.1 phosphodiester glycosidase family protein [Acinetobacter ursingii]MCU4380203.1 phosphodiester glycosidase family protein [Acinetobacter ursingii]MCU4609162.1 phosphodiester glycosidase family protein [Acinetobacter ursingii]
MSKWRSVLKSVVVLPVLSTLFTQSNYASERFDYQRVQLTQAGVDADVIQVKKLSDLQLFLNDPSQQPLLKFENIKKQLHSCQRLEFAMNAGMYHPDYAPVGLYIENGKQLTVLNEQQGFGNFFMQPNGVVAWNDQQVVIETTQDFKTSRFKANYATQSGPMLIIDGKINPKFLADSDSLKIRNGVGVKDNTLYFVITRNRVNFYQFAQFFKEQLKIDNALYLDGSISSLYLPKVYREDRRYSLGPMIGLINSKVCRP